MWWGGKGALLDHVPKRVCSCWLLIENIFGNYTEYLRGILLMVIDFNH